MNNQKLREEFEAWAKTHLIYGDDSEDVEGFDMRMECAYYIRTETQAAWEAWQASRAALVIELPNQSDEKYQEYFDDVEGGCFNSGKYLADAKAAIEAAGVGVKP